jgi:hypothetical protein
MVYHVRGGGGAHPAPDRIDFHFHVPVDHVRAFTICRTNLLNIPSFTVAVIEHYKSSPLDHAPHETGTLFIVYWSVYQPQKNKGQCAKARLHEREDPGSNLG